LVPLVGTSPSLTMTPFTNLYFGILLLVLISSYINDSNQIIEGYKQYWGYEIKFDYSKIRPEGSYISGGFKAPGHKGLQKSLELIESFIEKELKDKESIDFRGFIAYNIFMHLSDAVLSGGVRRSSMNIIMDKEDTEMVYAKTGNWRQVNPHFARSNNMSC